MSRTQIIVGVVLFGSAGFLGTAHLFASNSLKARGSESPSSAASETSRDAAQGHPLRVKIDRNLPRDIGLGLEWLANYLNKSNIPENPIRAQYFIANSLARTRTLIGWDAVLVNIEAVPDGVVAKLRVNAKRQGVIDSLSYYEFYLVNDDGVKLVGWEEDPNRNTDVVGH
jgi:hypothetical protein